VSQKERAHSKFSASGAERWFNCPGSVELSEGLPDTTSPAAEEGTQAHEVLEVTLKCDEFLFPGVDPRAPREMVKYADEAAKFIRGLAKQTNSEFLVEDRAHLDFIHPEAFGTLDSAVLDHFGTLHVIDYKYGKGYVVSPKENLQMIFYALALAHKYDWNFSRVRLWIIQPRAKGYDGPVFWDISIDELREYVPKFEDAVARVELSPEFKEGNHCFFCKAKKICPLKLESKNNKAGLIFGDLDGKEENDKEESGKEKKLITEAEWRKASRQTKERSRRAGC
jgi:hypothetical protein